MKKWVWAKREKNENAHTHTHNETWEKERHKTKTDTFFNGLHISQTSGCTKKKSQQKVTRCSWDRWYVCVESGDREKESWESRKKMNRTPCKKEMFKKEDLLIYTSHNFWHTRIKFPYFTLLFIIIIYYVAFSFQLRWKPSHNFSRFSFSFGIISFRT